MVERNTGKIQDDILMFRLIKAGDKHAFEYLFKTYFTPLCRFIRIYVKENEVAEELALDIFTFIWEKRGNLDIKQTLKSYLFQAARNRAMNYLRDNERFITISDWSALECFEVDDSLELKELERLITEAKSCYCTNLRRRIEIPARYCYASVGSQKLPGNFLPIRTSSERQ